MTATLTLTNTSKVFGETRAVDNVSLKIENGHFYQAKVADKTRKKGACLYCPGIGRNRKYTPPDFTK